MPDRGIGQARENGGQIFPDANLHSAAAVRSALNQWEALTRFLKDGEREIDNGATERANRDIALGRGNWTFMGSDGDGKTAAVYQTLTDMRASELEGTITRRWFRHARSPWGPQRLSGRTILKS